jgi:DNA mismatch repair ATPase MutS
MYRDRDLELERETNANDEALVQDLELNTLLNAMADNDQFLLEAVKPAVLSSLGNDMPTISYRQGILQDCLRNYPVIKAIYDIAVTAIESERRQWLGTFRTRPSTTLYGASELLQNLVVMLEKLKLVADQHAHEFSSEGFHGFFMLIKTELPEDYFVLIKSHLKELKFRQGALLSAELGEGNKGTNYSLRKGPGRKKEAWIKWIAGSNQPKYSFRINERDEAGARALSELRDRGVNEVANVAAQSADHILSFFVTLRTELAFYIGCVNLHQRLNGKVDAVCFPTPAQAGSGKFSYSKLCDTCLALTHEGSVVANDLNADGKKLFIITGANQGGKSTLLRAIGLAQLMMQCGMFVTAESFSADVCRSLFTHYKREEDVTMQSGKLDEELSRMSAIVDALTPDSMVLFNESFSATNEREGSEIASQIVHALVETRTKIFFVTHLYEFANRLWEERRDDSVFLRAERQADGRRTFKLMPGEALQTSFGPDLYKEIFLRGQRTPGDMIVEQSPI